MRFTVRDVSIWAGLALAVLVAMSVAASAQVITQRQGMPPAAQAKLPPPMEPALPADFAIGPDDVLFITVVGEQPMSGEFVVRPDGKIVMLQLDEIQAAGLKPEELKRKIKTELKRIFEEPVPEVFVQVKQIRSRVVYVQGAVNRQGAVPLTGPMSIVQLITLAGGLQEFADKKKILVISGSQKNAKGEPVKWEINYDDILKGRNLGKNNIELRPGDTVIVRGG